MALALWPLGYPDLALKRSQEALTLAQELAHPFSLAWALNWLAWVHHYRREGQATRERAEAGLALSGGQGFAWYVALGTILRGGALAEQGHGAAGIAQMHHGLAAYRATGVETGQPFVLTWLAAAYTQGGHIEEGLAALAEAFVRADKTGEHCYEVEQHRLKGELLLRQTISDAHQAQACFQQALTIARRQQAKSLELRAAMSLARLWQNQGKRKEAHDLLAPIYGWFTEGFGTPDIQGAQALLEDLL